MGVRDPGDGRPFVKAATGGDQGACGGDPELPTEGIDQGGQGAKGKPDGPFFPRSLVNNLDHGHKKQPGQPDREAAVKIGPDDDGQDVKKRGNGAAMAFALEPVKP